MLSGKKVLVFGAGGKIGWQAVQAVVDAGGDVIAVDMQFNDEQIYLAQSKKNNIEINILDVCDENALIEFFNNVHAIDGVVNLSYPRGPNFGRDFLKVNIGDFNKTLGMHLGSAVHITQLCVKFFLAKDKPLSVVNFSSIYGVVAPRFDIYRGENFTVPIEYALAKSAIQHLNKYVSTYIRNSDFRINTISPGGIFDAHSKEFQDAYSHFTRGRGLLDSVDMMGGLIFLLSDNSAFVSGQNIIIDDGFTL